jgi:hypothetical protein
MTPEQEKVFKELERVLKGYLEQEGPLKTALVIAKIFREEDGDAEITWKSDGSFIIRSRP